MIKNIGKIIFGLILIATIFTYFEILLIHFDVSLMNLYLIKIVVFSFMLYHLIFFRISYRNLFEEIPYYWTKSRKENQEILKKNKKIYSIKEKIKLISFFILYIFMLVALSVFIYFDINLINIITSIGLFLFFIDIFVISYKLI